MGPRAHAPNTRPLTRTPPAPASPCAKPSTQAEKERLLGELKDTLARAEVSMRSRRAPTRQGLAGAQRRAPAPARARTRAFLSVARPHPQTQPPPLIIQSPLTVQEADALRKELAEMRATLEAERKDTEALLVRPPPHPFAPTHACTPAQRAARTPNSPPHAPALDDGACRAARCTRLVAHPALPPSPLRAVHSQAAFSHAAADDGTPAPAS